MRNFRFQYVVTIRAGARKARTLANTASSMVPSLFIRCHFINADRNFECFIEAASIEFLLLSLYHFSAMETLYSFDSNCF